MRDPAFRHRDRLLRHRFDEKSRALLDPGETLLVTVGGVTRLHAWRYGVVVAMGAVSGAFGSRPHFWMLALIGWLLAGAGLWVVGPRRIMVALTAVGVIEFGTDWLGRPRSIRRRASIWDHWTFEGNQHGCEITAGDVALHASRTHADLLWAAMENQRELRRAAPVRTPA